MPSKKKSVARKPVTEKPVTRKTRASSRAWTASTASTREGVKSTAPAMKKERRTVARKLSNVSSIDIDRVVREEVTEWFTSNRKGLEQVFRRVADQVREDMETIFQERLDEERERAQAEIRRLAEENAGLRERVRGMEEEQKRMRSILSMVRNQVAEEGGSSAE